MRFSTVVIISFQRSKLGTSSYNLKQRKRVNSQYNNLSNSTSIAQLETFDVQMSINKKA